MKYWYRATVECEGVIEVDRPVDVEKKRKTVEWIIDGQLKGAESHNEDIKLNVWRSEPITVFRKLEFDE